MTKYCKDCKFFVSNWMIEGFENCSFEKKITKEVDTITGVTTIIGPEYKHDYKVLNANNNSKFYVATTISDIINKFFTI